LREFWDVLLALSTSRVGTLPVPTSALSTHAERRCYVDDGGVVVLVEFVETIIESVCDPQIGEERPRRQSTR
jgi:hypothetical protein